MKRTLFFLLTLTLLAPLLACGGGGTGGGTTGGTGGGTSATDDFVVLSLNSGGNSTYTEAFHATIACNPRVDWASNQVILWGNYTGTGPVQGFEMAFDIMFGLSDAVGTYTVQNDPILVSYIDGTGTYTASQVVSNSSGTVTVTRSDTRIEGTYSFTLVDGNNVAGPTVSGSFGVDKGHSLSCP